jgi:ArsR family transcriptional regulator
MLRPGGTVTVITLKEHAYAHVTAAYGHRCPGFRPSMLTSHLKNAGLVVQSNRVVCRERRAPHFEVIAAFAQKPESP